MKSTALYLALTLLAASPALICQTTGGPSEPSGAFSSSSQAGDATQPPATAMKKYDTTPAPFSRIGLSVGISAMGVNLQAATNVNRYINVRAVGNYFSYTVTNVTTNGLTANGKLSFATAGASVDFYPFPNHGLRLSPGVLFLNDNAVTANITVTGGTSFRLNGVEYYSSVANPVVGTGSVGLNAQNPAFTMTTGWGNLISRRGGHWSFPVEIGAAFVGSPAVNIGFTSGEVCSQGGTTGSQSVVGDTALNTDLQAQIAKYKSDLNPLQVYPIFSFGLGYNFHIR